MKQKTYRVFQKMFENISKKKRRVYAITTVIPLILVSSLRKKLKIHLQRDFMKSIRLLRIDKLPVAAAYIPPPPSTKTPHFPLAQLPHSLFPPPPLP